MNDQAKPKAHTKPQKPINPPVRSAHAEELVDHYWGSINYVTGLIKASELKAGLILSFYGILFNLIYQSVAMFLTDVPNEIFLYILFGVWFVFTVISIYFSIRCFIPKIEAKFDKNVFFFEDVISKFGTVQEFSKTFYKISLNEEELFLQLGQQIFVISKIAAFKFKNVNRSIWFLALGLLLLLAITVYYLVITLK